MQLFLNHLKSGNITEIWLKKNLILMCGSPDIIAFQGYVGSALVAANKYIHEGR